MLRYLFKDSPKVLSQIDNLTFEPSAIIEIAQVYHNDVCKDYECILYTKDGMKIHFDFGLYSGYAISKMRPESDYFKKMNNDFLCDDSFLVGFFINVMDPGVSEKMSLQLDAILQNGKYVFESSSYQMSYMKIPLSIKYAFTDKKIRPAAQFGFAYNKWLKYDSENIIASHIEGEAFQKRTYQFGILAGADISYTITEKLSLFLLCRYEIYAGKPWNQYIIPDFNGIPYLIPESVKTYTSFASFSLGFKF